MALVAPQEWSTEMDSRQQRPHSNTDPANNPHSSASPSPAPSASTSSSPSPSSYAQAGNPASYGYATPWHMQMGTHMNVNPPQGGYYPQMQFYPQHFQHPQSHSQLPQHLQHQHHPQPHQMHHNVHGMPPPGAHFGPQPPPQSQMYDPNAQFAQWAYQQMMFNAQQNHQLNLNPGMPQQQQPQRPRSGSNTGSNAGTPTNEYNMSTPFGGHAPHPAPRFQQSPSPQASSAPGLPPSTNSNNQPTTAGGYQGFHPYRRPDRGDRRTHTDHQSNASSASSPSPSSAQGHHLHPQHHMNSVPFQPPYARQDAAGSTTSVNSSSSASQRSRTNSGTSQKQHTPRQASVSSAASAPRSVSSSSTAVSGQQSSSTPTARTARPSPLSQASTMSNADRRKSRDDSDLAAMVSGVNLSGNESSGVPMARNGLKGRLRRAFSLSAAQTMEEEKAGGKKGVRTAELNDDDDEQSMATKKTKKSLRMFNSRFNASTDNISLSSTVSSASVMIRKLGSMGKLARRNSLAGITSLFKDKEKNKDGDPGEESEAASKSGKKAKGKGKKAEVSVSHVTAELDKTSDWSAPGLEGLSPAAKLARQHTLKSNAEAAARAKAQAEAQAASAAAAGNAVQQGGLGANGEQLPTTWEHNTTTRQGVGAAGTGRVREDGMRLVVEEEFEEAGEMIRHSSDLSASEDEDSTWHGHGQEEEDTTVRMDRGVLNEGEEMDEDNLDEPWAMNIRRSVERSRKPARGILKNASTYSQDGQQPVGPNASFIQRMRANSYDSVPTHQNELGPLAHIPSPDPDHIDGLHRHGSHRSNHSNHKDNSNSHSTASSLSGPPLLPPLSFESPQPMSPIISASSSLKDDDASSLTLVSNGASNGNCTGTDSKRASSVYNHPGLNNSEPTLSTMLSSPPTLQHRSATTPAKRLVFATNLSIYDTFSSSVYDRRSEPATWSRLTPALAQRIKEELNSYKMEEMEVHASSRVHTQFFV